MKKPENKIAVKIKSKRRLPSPLLKKKFRHKPEDCTVTASELLMPEVSSGVIQPSRVGGGTDSCPRPWGRLSMDELERGESGIKSSDSNREARLQGPLGVLEEKPNLFITNSSLCALRVIMSSWYGIFLQSHLNCSRKSIYNEVAAIFFSE